MRHISVQSFKEVVAAETGNSAVDFINVCTAAEFTEKHIPGVRNVPLSDIEQHLAEFTGKQTVYVHCRSGQRAAAAIEKLVRGGVTAELVNVEGGIMAWEQAGLPTTSLTQRMPIMRQVLLAAGILVLGSVSLGWLVSEVFYIVTAFVGGGLAVAGATGWCGMAYALAKMPWNSN